MFIFNQPKADEAFTILAKSNPGRYGHAAALQQEFANHMRLQLSVEDTGIGIREEDMQRLFGLFSKVARLSSEWHDDWMMMMIALDASDAFPAWAHFRTTHWVFVVGSS